MGGERPKTENEPPILRLPSAKVMNNLVIYVENLGKRYRIGELQKYKALRDTLTNALHAPFRAAAGLLNGRRSSVPGPDNFIWALKDVSFEVKQGEVVGIIGRNGAGKSTLLKILSRITKPTEGYARIHGRVGSLLEVGTGFHPELTGRENIYLNGAILGMRKKEIDRKFDEIVAFAEVENFIDTPMKFYSSGMSVRLAFAVAAHLEPEVLLVDEVLAVGDAVFQKKCLGKMGDVAKEGRTVLFVSHNMAAVRSLCERACLLDAGRITCQGPPDEVIDQYLQSVQLLMPSESTALDQRKVRSGDGSAKIVDLKIEDADGKGIIRSNSRLKLTIGYRSDKPILYPQFSATIYDYNKGVGIMSLLSETVGGLPEILPPEGKVICITEPIYLTPGRCYVNLALRKGGAERADYIQYAAYFDVEVFDIYGSGKIPGRDWVLCLRKHAWSVDGG